MWRRSATGSKSALSRSHGSPSSDEKLKMMFGFYYLLMLYMSRQSLQQLASPHRAGLIIIPIGNQGHLKTDGPRARDVSMAPTPINDLLLFCRRSKNKIYLQGFSRSPAPSSIYTVVKIINLYPVQVRGGDRRRPKANKDLRLLGWRISIEDPWRNKMNCVIYAYYRSSAYNGRCKKGEAQSFYVNLHQDLKYNPTAGDTNVLKKALHDQLFTGGEKYQGEAKIPLIHPISLSAKYLGYNISPNPRHNATPFLHFKTEYQAYASLTSHTPYLNCYRFHTRLPLPWPKASQRHLPRCLLNNPSMMPGGAIKLYACTFRGMQVRREGSWVASRGTRGKRLIPRS